MATQTEVAHQLSFSIPSVRSYVHELERLELVQVKPGGGRGRQLKMSIREQWRDALGLKWSGLHCEQQDSPVFHHHKPESKKGREAPENSKTNHN